MTLAIQIFKALSDETRVTILLLLAQQNVCAKGISKRLNISEAAVSQHIKILKEAGIIIGYKQGYRVHYSVNEDTLNALITFINDLKVPVSSVKDTSCPMRENCPKTCCHLKTQGGE